MIARHWTGIVALNFQAIGYEVFATLSKTKNDMSETKGMMQKKNYLVPSCLSQLFKTRNSQYCLRNCDYEMPRFNPTGYGKHTYNKIPGSLYLVAIK